MKVDSVVGLLGARDAAKYAQDLGYDGVWTAEVDHDPFFPIAIAADAAQELDFGTGIAVAFARSPMNLAQIGNDLQIITRGRFMLGLGSQIKPHITRRFSMPWSQPAARMREFVLAMHAIWDCWEGDGKLDFKGDFYEHTLMSPFFNPGPNPHGRPKVFLAAVGPKMTEVVGEVCDGMLCHGFTTERYLREHTIPALERGVAKAGRSMADITLSIPAFVVTGDDEATMNAAADAVRAQIAFYGSTPAYRSVLELHGWGDLQTELHSMSRSGQWAEMGGIIDDEVLNTFAVVGEPGAIAQGLLERFGDVLHRISFYAPYAPPAEGWGPIVQELKAHKG